MLSSWRWHRSRAPSLAVRTFRFGPSGPRRCNLVAIKSGGVAVLATVSFYALGQLRSSGLLNRANAIRPDRGSTRDRVSTLCWATPETHARAAPEQLYVQVK